MNHAGEIDAAGRRWCGRMSPIITTVEPVHLEFFAGIEAIADAKAEIFDGLEPGGAAVLNRDNPQFARLAAQRRGARHRAASSPSATHEKADARLLDLSLQRGPAPPCTRDILGHDVTYKLGAPGRHMAMNSLAVLAAASLAGADLALAALALSQVAPAAGRGVRRMLEVGRRRGDR